jgi:hypothetical protein
MADDKDAQKARAERLRQEIDRLTNPSSTSKDRPSERPETPHEFVQRRMRELQQQQKKS